MKPILARVLLAWVLLLQAPLMGAMTVHMTAAQAGAGDQGTAVICTANGIKTVALADPVPGEMPVAVDCHCPCATAHATGPQPMPGGDAHRVLYPRQRTGRLARARSHIPPQPHIDRRTGSPRSPPLHSV